MCAQVDRQLHRRHSCKGATAAKAPQPQGPHECKAQSRRAWSCNCRGTCVATHAQAKASSHGQTRAQVAGRKSAALAAAVGGKKGAKAAAKAAAAALGQGATKHGKTEFGTSGAVFAK